MIQPAALPFAGNVQTLLGLPGDAAVEPGNSADFSTLLAAKIEGGQAGNPPALMLPPKSAAANGSSGGKGTGKADGKNLQHGLAGAGRLLPKAEDGLPCEIKAKGGPEGDPQSEPPPSNLRLGDQPNGLTLGSISNVSLQAPTTAIPPQPARRLATAPQAQSAPVEAEVLAPNGPAGTPGRQSVKQRFNQVTFLSPSPPFDRLRMSGARGGGGGSTPAGRGGDKRTSPEAGASPGSAPAPAQLITIGVLPQPVVALPTAAMPLADFSLLRPEPLTAEPGAYVSVDIAAAVSLPLRETTPPAAIMAQLLRPASLTAAPPAFNPLALAPLEIAGGELLPATALQPVPTAPGLPFAPPAIAAAMPRAVEQPREQAEPRDLEPSLAAATGSPTADTAPAPLPPAAANPLALQPLANPAAPPASQTPAAAQPHGFAALIDRLVEARDMAQASAAPGTVHAAVTHAEFGTVSLQFQHDAAGLTVALASADPEFARAVQAAAPAPGASDQHTQARQEAPGQQSSSSAQTPSNPQQRGQSAPRDAQDPRHSAGPGQRQRASDEPPTRGGIFA